MCTILTFSRDFYTKNKDAVHRQITTDAISNSDGFAMLLMGADADNTNLLRVMNVDMLLSMLDYAMENEYADRAWIHCRFATSGFRGLNGCHGFAAGDYTVFHNGVLSRKESHGFRVDSELIAFDIDASGLDAAIDNLMQHDSYANVFIVDNETGTYTVVRKATGSLYTDGQGNYSTHAFASIASPVPVNTKMEYDEHIVEYRPVSSYSSLSWSRYEYEDDVSEDIKLQIDCLPYIHTFDDFADMAEYEGWVKLGIPDEVWDNLSVDQLTWANRLGLLPGMARKVTVA